MRRREMAGIGDEDLHRDRAKPDQERGEQIGQRMRDDRGRGERNGSERDDAEHQVAVLDEIAERHDQEQPRAVAELGHGDDQAGGLRRKAELGRDRTNQRLGIVEIGGDQAAGQRQQEGNPGRDRRGFGEIGGDRRHSSFPFFGNDCSLNFCPKKTGRVASGGQRHARRLMEGGSWRGVMPEVSWRCRPHPTAPAAVGRTCRPRAILASDRP